MRAEDAGLRFGLGGFGEVWDFLDPELEGLPVDHDNDLEREKRILEGEPEEARGGEGAGVALDAGDEGDFALAEVVDFDSEVFAGEAEIEVEGIANVGEGRDVEFLGDGFLPGVGLLVIDEIELHLAVGVHDFGDGEERGAIGFAEVEKGDGIEAVSEDAGESHEFDAGVGGEVDFLFGEPGEEVGFDTAGVAEVDVIVVLE